MVNPRQNDDFPTIRLDDEDRRSYQQKKQTNNSDVPTPASVTVKSKSGFPFTASLALLLSLAACGGGYYFYDLNQKQAALNQAAEARIAELENKLSATGEEMGESTVALQVKVNELSARTTELWEQMDKLWASAWRRNQKEIGDLDLKLNRVQKGLEESINQVSRNTTAQTTKLAAIDSQVTNLNNELLALNVQLEQSLAEQQQAIQNSKDLSEQLAVIKQRNSAITGRITQVENEIKALSTKLVSQDTGL